MLSKPESGWAYLKKRETDLNKKLEELRKVIDNQKEYFSDSCFFL